MTTRKELVEALRERYRSAAFGDRIKILDEFVAVTGYHRKHAIRVLRDEIATAKAARPARTASTPMHRTAGQQQCQHRLLHGPVVPAPGRDAQRQPRTRSQTLPAQETQN